MTPTTSDDLRLTQRPIQRPQPPLWCYTARMACSANGVVAFLRRLSASQWLLLIYPVFMYIVRRQRAADDLAVVDGSATAQIVLTAVCGTYILYRWLASGWGMIELVVRAPLVWLGVYSALAVVSAMWSDLPTLTFFRGVQLIVFLMLVADALSGFRDLRDIFKYQLCYAVLVAIFSQFISLLGGASLGGLHSSEVPGAIIGVAFIGALVAGWQWRLLYAFVLMAVVLGTSTGAFIAGLCGLSVMLVFSRGRSEYLGWLLGGLLLLMMILAPDILLQGVFLGKSENEISSATGRLPVWQWTFDIVMQERPWLGFGFGYGEAMARLNNLEGLRMQHMHSAVLSSLSNLGLIGLALLVGFWATTFGQVLRASRKGLRPVLLGAISAIAVNSLAMESITAPLAPAWIAHMLLYGIGGWIICSDEFAGMWFRFFSAHQAGTCQRTLRRSPI